MQKKEIYYVVALKGLMKKKSWLLLFGQYSEIVKKHHIEIYISGGKCYIFMRKKIIQK